MKNSNSPIILFIFLLLSTGVFAQEENTGPKSLKDQFQEMLESSESYTDYKVVRRTKLNEYSSAVQDSLAKSRTRITALSTEVKDLKNQVSQLSVRITDLESQLAESESLRDGLVFLGINMNKATYHTLVWVIIAGLAIFGIFAYVSFMRSNSVTAKTKKEMKALELEYDDHRKTSQEKQIKMGRELQTERNLVEELKNKLKVKSTPK
jgi:peptidoglycan hydrolase CwlO-like protein